MSACECTGPDSNVRGLPLSSACQGRRICGGCTGFEDGHATRMCDCRCHWCPGGLHLRETAR